MDQASSSKDHTQIQTEIESEIFTTPTTTTQSDTELISLPSTDPGIICFNHCNTKIFCIGLPRYCPFCKILLREKSFTIPPFRMPYPFGKASDFTCAVILRPTIGDFLNDYNNDKDLHIAVTTSKGDVVEFDRNGIKKHLAKSLPGEWSQCLCIKDLPEDYNHYWDYTLDEALTYFDWSPEKYDEKDYNCYTFVLKFLQILFLEELTLPAVNRETFCKRLIVPKTTAAGKYISLYRKLLEYRFYCRRGNKYCYLVPGLKKSNKLATIEE